MMEPRPFRFGIVATEVSGATEWAQTAREAEDSGFAALLLPELPPPVPAPLPALAFAAAVTSTLELGTWVLANDFRNPVTVAREAATLDLLTGGRFRVGIGAGQPGDGYPALGITAGSGAARVERLAESVRIINTLFRGGSVHAAGGHYSSAGARLLPPPERKILLLIAAGGRRATELAATFLAISTTADGTWSANCSARQRFSTMVAGKVRAIGAQERGEGFVRHRPQRSRWHFRGLPRMCRAARVG
ncbi:hypothetical protein C5E45_26180 [Nocardia nova]|uniref:Luciferase-like domain-containing protein n=2 Tax=Nocardia nova TaxID=37330 RepID=A0A2S6AJE9_9NOCA|nr:hypothetical protein C5E45_26180 [Nocardia nova]